MKVDGKYVIFTMIFDSLTAAHYPLYRKLINMVIYVGKRVERSKSCTLVQISQEIN